MESPLGAVARGSDRSGLTRPGSVPRWETVIRPDGVGFDDGFRPDPALVRRYVSGGRPANPRARAGADGGLVRQLVSDRRPSAVHHHRSGRHRTGARRDDTGARDLAHRGAARRDRALAVRFSEQCRPAPRRTALGSGRTAQGVHPTRAGAAWRGQRRVRVRHRLLDADRPPRRQGVAPHSPSRARSR